MTEIRIDHLFGRMKGLSHVAAILLALSSTTMIDDNKTNADIMRLVLVSDSEFKDHRGWMFHIILHTI